MNVVNLRVIKRTASKSMVLCVAHNYQHFPKRSNPTLGGGVGVIGMLFSFRESTFTFTNTRLCEFAGKRVCMSGIRHYLYKSLSKYV